MDSINLQEVKLIGLSDVLRRKREVWRVTLIFLILDNWEHQSLTWATNP